MNHNRNIIPKSVYCYDYPIGPLGIAEEDGAVCGVFFGRSIPDGFQHAETPLIQQAAAQLKGYFAGTLKAFTLPLALHGTEFQNAVWQALQEIPWGQTRTYGEIARAIGKPQASRAVGMANNRNPIVIIIPCHRVIGQDGSLTGYGGGLPVKQFLLDLENR